MELFAPWHGPSRCSLLHWEVEDNHPGAVISLNIQYLPDRFMFCMAGSSCLIFFFFFSLIPSPFAPINPHIWPISSAIWPCQSTFFFFFLNQCMLETRCHAELQFRQSCDLLIIILWPVRKSITSEEHCVTSGLFPENFTAMTEIVRRNFGSTVWTTLGSGCLNQSQAAYSSEETLKANSKHENKKTHSAVPTIREQTKGEIVRHM